MIQVKKLMKLLRDMPPDAYVGIAAHDQPEDDIDSAVNSVVLRDPDLSTDPSYLPKVTVVIRG